MSRPLQLEALRTDDLDPSLAEVRGLVAVRRARAAIRTVGEAGDDVDVAYDVVEHAIELLADAAADPSCAPRVGDVLLDWRDRLASHLLAARALAELDVHHPGTTEQLLRRGLDEVIGEAPKRFAEARPRPATSSSPP